jgi:hypothetical protein
MRDGEPEWTAEQRHDREPIGASADHAGLGEGAQVSQPRPARSGEAGGDENAGHQHEQRKGDRPHTPQIGELGFRVLDFGFGGSGKLRHFGRPPWCQGHAALAESCDARTS